MVLITGVGTAQIAKNVMFPVIVYEFPGVKKIGSPPDSGLLQYCNVKPDLVGVGTVTTVPDVPEFDVGETVPPLASQFTVNVIAVHWA